MDLTKRRDIKQLLKQHKITPAQTYGQHFLVNRQVLESIVEAAQLKKTDLILEVGPGLGTLTLELARRAGQIIAIERDSRFREVLKETLVEYNNVHVLDADVMKVSLTRLLTNNKRQKVESCKFKVVSNLPYEISTPFLWKVLAEEEVVPESIVLLLQAEVVERIIGQDKGKQKMNLLPLLVALAGKPKKIKPVPKSAFLPLPKVNSAIIAIENIQPLGRSARAALALAKRAFASPRRKLKTTLGSQAGKYEDLRPEQLEAGDWLELAGGGSRR